MFFLSQRAKTGKLFTLTLVLLCCGLVVACSKKSTDEHLQAAQEFIQQQQPQAAIVELKNALQLSPQSPMARFQLGQVYLQTKQFEAAEKELNLAMEYGHPASAVIPLLSQAYQRSGAHVALAKLDIEQGLSPVEQLEVGFYKVQSLVQLDKTDDARALIETLAHIDSRSVYQGLVQAYLPILDKDYDLALSQVQKLRAQAPLNKDVLHLQAQLHLMLNQVSQATAVYQIYLQQNPDELQTKFVLAKLLVDQGNTVAAEPYVDELMAMSADNAVLNQLKGIIRAAANDYAGGQQFSEKAIHNGRADPVLRLVAGFSAYQQGDFSAATRHLAYIASALPDNHPGLKLLAASQLQLGQSSQASDILARIDQPSAADAQLFSRAGYELLRSGNVKQAKQIVEKTSTISATADDLTRLGVLQLSINDVQGIVNLESALAKAPESVTAYSTLATAYLATEQLDKAMQLAQSWKQANPDDIRAHLLAGQVLTRRQDFAGAKQEYTRALATEPDNNGIKMALVNLDLVQDKLPEAEQQLRQILASSADFLPALASYYVVKRQQQQAEQGIQPTLAAFAAAPNNQNLRFLLAKMHNFQGDFAKSLALLTEIKQNQDTPNDYWQIKGQALLQLNQLSAAEQHYDKWLSFAPNDTTANLGKLLLLDSQSEFAQGLALIQDYMQHRDDAQMTILHSYFLVMNRETAAARKAYTALPAAVQALPFVKGVLARLQLQENAPQQALPNALAAYDSSPGSRNALLVVLCHETLGQASQSYAFLTEHVLAHPNDLRALMLLAERQIAKDANAAIDTYTQALKLSPNNFVLLNNLAYLYLQQGSFDDANIYASRAVALQPENAAALDTLAQVLVANGDYAEALQYYDRVIDDTMANEEIYLNYVEALLLAEQHELAKRKLSQRQMQLPASVTRVQRLKSQYGI